MNWIGYLLLFLSVLCVWFAGFYYGRGRGHAEGHRCERIQQWLVYLKTFEEKEETRND